MRRIATGSNRNPAIDLFGTGKHGFKTGNRSLGDPPSTPGGEWYNSVQEELARAIEGAGIALDAAKYDQLLAAIKSIAWGAEQTAPPSFRGRLGTTDISTFFVAGAWQQNLSANATTSNGYPFSEAGLLENYAWGANQEDCVQRYTSFLGNKFAIRTYYKTQNKLTAWSVFDVSAIDTQRPYESSAANIKMDGVQSVGSLNTVARGDHVHPTDTSRVAKAGDTMSGSLKTRYTSDWVGFSADNPTEGKSTFFDGQVAGVPRGGMQIKPAAGGNGEYFTTIAATPAGATNADRRVGGLDVYAGGLYANAYGWLHDYFLKRSDCVVGWYPSHYGGAQTFKIRNLNLMITTMYVTGLGADTTLNLPEAYTGVVHAFATDAGSGKNNVGAAAVNGTQVRVYAGPVTSTNILLIGYKDNI